MKSVTMTCRLCSHHVTLKGDFWNDWEEEAIGNLMLVPHFWKCHREAFNFKVYKGMIKSILFLLLFVPFHALMFCLLYSLYPLYWILKKIYG